MIIIIDPVISGFICFTFGPSNQSITWTNYMIIVLNLSKECFSACEEVVSDQFLTRGKFSR